jgi:hypothetical protein
MRTVLYFLMIFSSVNAFAFTKSYLVEEENEVIVYGRKHPFPYLMEYNGHIYELTFVDQDNPDARKLVCSNTLCFVLINHSDECSCQN